MITPAAAPIMKSSSTENALSRSMPYRGRNAMLFESLDVAARCLEVHLDEKRDVEEQRRDQRGERDLRVRHLQEFRHQECGDPHHRRHDLAAGGSRGLDRSG